MKNRFQQWMDGEIDFFEHMPDSSKKPDLTRDEIKTYEEEKNRKLEEKTLFSKRKGFYAVYNVVAIISCVLLIGVLLFTVANLPEYGHENPRTTEVVSRYIEDGVEETGAVNVVAGMILDYRAFDTLGESHVLFTALICVTILLRFDHKNLRTDYEDYYQSRLDTYFDTSKDTIMQKIGLILLPSLLLFGIYILLNGQISPGGGFSGGAIIGAALILFAVSYGFDKVDTFFTLKASTIITFVSLTFYSFAKGYVFFTGANGIENGIPKGIPGAILSGGLILPLNIAVGMVVACTMFGFYSLFRRGSVGSD